MQGDNDTSKDSLEALRAQVQFARKRYQSYKTRVFEQWPTDRARLREYEQACSRAEARLDLAEAAKRLA